MTFDPLRFLAELHGHLGWLAAAALLHPAILLRDPARWVGSAEDQARGKPRRRHGLAIALACGLVSAAALAGALLYVFYRESVRPALFATTPSIGWMFERKEHLAFGAAAFAWAGVLAGVAAIRAKEDPMRVRLAQASHRAFVMATALTFVTAVLGTWVASVKSF